MRNKEINNLKCLYILVTLKSVDYSLNKPKKKNSRKRSDNNFKKNEKKKKN